MELIWNLTFWIKIKSSDIFSILFSIGGKEPKKGKLKIELFLKKVNFQYYIFRNEKKAEKSKVRKKDDFQFSLSI